MSKTPSSQEKRHFFSKIRLSSFSTVWSSLTGRFITESSIASTTSKEICSFAFIRKRCPVRSFSLQETTLEYMQEY